MTPSIVKDGELKISDPAQIAETFNSFITNIVNKYIPNTSKPVPNYEKLITFIYSKVSPNALFDIPLVPEDFVLKELNSLDPKKAVGIDILSSKFAAPAIASSVTNVINLSNTSGKFPSIWKIARVCLIFKSGNHEETANYRSISILCVLSKIHERHIDNHLYHFLTDHKLLHLAQSGVRKFHSCETALAKMVSKWASNINKGDLTGIVLLDLYKAFDLVDHNLLLHKLSIYRISDRSLKRFKTYLKR